MVQRLGFLQGHKDGIYNPQPQISGNIPKEVFGEVLGLPGIISMPTE